ncbi:2-keto-3-deoxygluconate kinase [Halobacteriales archaeon QS_8_69_26]|nr:MAG: 2-keto-3-deoxygluconate kinase [Halobacteriales archaeon QS_8_69_26]
MASIVTFGETMLRFTPPGDGRVETTGEMAVHVGGAESNVAVTAARLGLDAAWTSKLPDSPPGRRVVDGVRRHGVEPLVTWSDEGRQGLYYLEDGPEPLASEVTYDRTGAPVRTATPDELPVERIRAADAFFVTGITPALSDTLAATTGELLATARGAGTLTAFDVNYRAKLWTPTAARETLSDLLPDVDLLFVAERDADAVFDRAGDPAEVAAGFADDYDLGTAVLTRGEEGALAVRDGAVHDQDAFPAGSAHPVGSGDAFVGGYLARRLAGGGTDEALEYGAATAALKRGIPGDVAVVTPEQVRHVVEGGADGISR